MSRREAGNGGGAPRKMLVSQQLSCSRERDEDLVLFREMHKREKDVRVSLLQPISDEFEANGKRSGTGLLEFLAEGGKNDYDWLKTPPATPLFPSLEMEGNAPQLVVQREIPVIQPLSRFAGNSETARARSTQSSRSPIPKPKAAARHVTPSGTAKSTTSSLADKKNMKSSAPGMNHLPFSGSGHAIEKSSSGKSIHPNNRPASNLISNSMGAVDSSVTKPTSRGVSPLVRPKITAQSVPGFSAETPSNLRTDRSLSASRGRSRGYQQGGSAGQKQESGIIKPRRQSCSPSVTRGRKMETEGNTALLLQTGRFHQTNRAQIVGSRMVDKFLIARMSGAEERKIKTKLDGSVINQNSGFGRMMSNNSLDMALKHMDFPRHSVNVHGHGPTYARKS